MVMTVTGEETDNYPSRDVGFTIVLKKKNEGLYVVLSICLNTRAQLYSA